MIPPFRPALLDDFSDVDLHAVAGVPDDHVAARLSGDASGVEWHEVTLDECRIDGALLTGAELVGWRLHDVEVVASDLSGATLVEPVMARVLFRECRLSATSFERARLTDVVFLDCRMDTVGLSLARIERLRAERCDLRDASFRHASLDHVALIECGLDGADFGEVRLDGLALHGSSLDSVRNVAGLRGASIDESQEIPLALQLLRQWGVEVTDGPDGPA